MNKFDPKFPNYDDDSDYNTNANSYYKDLGRKTKLIKLLAKRIWEYENTLNETLEQIEQRLTDYIQENDVLMNERLENWDKRIDEMPEEMKSLFVTWLNDGTLEKIINHDVLGNKADKSFVDTEIERLEKKDENITTQLTHNIKINVKDFGAVGDYNANRTDDTNAINLAINEAKKHSKAVLLFPFADGGYATTDTIHIPENIDVFMESPIVYIGTEDIVGLKIGSDERSNFTSDLKLRFIRHNKSNWESEENIGIQVVNADSSNINIFETRGSTIGVQYIGYNHGFAYNECTHYYFVDNKIQVDLTNDLKGWCNENNFYGGRLTSFTHTHLDKSRVGVRITSKETASIKDNNNNIFYKPSFELIKPNEGNEALPILVEHGRSNRFYDARNEFNTKPMMRTYNNSNYNYVSVGYSDTGTPEIDNVGTFMGNLVEFNFRLIKEKFKPFFHLENLSGLLNPYDPTTNYLKKVHIRKSDTSEPLLYTARVGIDFEGESLKMHNGSGFGFFLDTTHQKKFNITWKGDMGIHLAIIPFDKNNNKIVDTTVKTDDPISMTYTSSVFGGCFMQGAPNRETSFSVDNEVSRVEVILFTWGVGNDNRKINAFSISAKEPVAITTAFPEFYDKAVALARPSRVTPATKTHSFVYRRNLTVSGDDPKNILLGWICIDSEENTWKAVRITTDD